MKEFLGRIRIVTSIWAWVMIALGALLIIKPGEIIDLVCQISGALFILTGAALIISVWVKKAGSNVGFSTSYFKAILGGIVLAAGVFIVINPRAIAGFISFLIAIILLINATNDIVEMRSLRIYGIGKWFLCLVSFALKFICAILIIMRPFDGQKVFFVFMGIALIYAGVSALMINYHVIRGFRNFKKAAEAAAREQDLRNGIVDGQLVDEEIIDVTDETDVVDSYKIEDKKRF